MRCTTQPFNYQNDCFITPFNTRRSIRRANAPWSYTSFLPRIYLLFLCPIISTCNFTWPFNCISLFLLLLTDAAYFMYFSRCCCSTKFNFVSVARFCSTTFLPFNLCFFFFAAHTRHGVEGCWGGIWWDPTRSLEAHIEETKNLVSWN